MAGATAAATALARNRLSATQVAEAEGVMVDAGSTAGVAAVEAVQDAASVLADAVATVAKHFLPDGDADRQVPDAAKERKKRGKKGRKKAESETRASH